MINKFKSILWIVLMQRKWTHLSWGTSVSSSWCGSSSDV